MAEGLRTRKTCFLQLLLEFLPIFSAKIFSCILEYRLLTPPRQLVTFSITNCDKIFVKSLLKYLICASLTWIIVPGSHGAYNFLNDGGSFIVLDLGSGNEYFSLGPNSGGIERVFDGVRLNEYHPSPDAPVAFRHTFDTLVLNGFQNNFIQNGSDTIVSGNLSYRIYERGTTPGPFNVLTSTSSSPIAGGVRYENTTADISILDAIPYTAVYIFQAYAWADVDNGDGGSPFDDVIFGGSSGTIYQSGGGSAPGDIYATVNIERLPEPSTVGLLGVGIVLVRTLRKKKPLQPVSS
jgi:hypothetical protein